MVILYNIEDINEVNFPHYLYQLPLITQTALYILIYFKSFKQFTFSKFTKFNSAIAPGLKIRTSTKWLHIVYNTAKKNLLKKLFIFFRKPRRNGLAANVLDRFKINKCTSNKIIAEEMFYFSEDLFFPKMPVRETLKCIRYIIFTYNI